MAGVRLIEFAKDTYSKYPFSFLQDFSWIFPVDCNFFFISTGRKNLSNLLFLLSFFLLFFYFGFLHFLKIIFLNLPNIDKVSLMSFFKRFFFKFLLIIEGFVLFLNI
jgi:hypothetical protein